MYGTDYSRWDNIKDSDDDATAPAPAPMPPPQKPQSDQPLDPTNVAAMRELLHEIDDGRRPHLLAAIEWVEAARATLDRGEAVDDGQCPFDRGSEPWFWFLLLANKPHITLHGPHKPRLACEEIKQRVGCSSRRWRGGRRDDSAQRAVKF